MSATHLRALVAPQQFKGTLTARQACQAIASGLRAAQPDAQLELAPLADGGQGTVDALLGSQSDGEDRLVAVRGPIGDPVLARWGYLPSARGGPLGVIEMAAASGLVLLPRAQKVVLAANTFGTGQLIRAALDAGCRSIAVGAGDSGTCDAGIGAAVALGAKLFDARGAELPPVPRALERLERIELGGLDPRLKTVPIAVLADVTNPLLGERGTARVYAPQKGADADDVDFLEAALQHLALVVRRQLGVELDSAPGSGAAGGLAFGLAALCGATVSRGFDAVSEALDLFGRLADVDVVLTGEGQLDAQTAFAKGPWSLGRLARMQKKCVVAFAGKVVGSAASAREAFDEVVQVTPDGEGLPSSADAARLLTEAARTWASGPRRRTTGETAQR